MTKQEIYNKLRETFHSKSGCFLSKKSCEELAHEISSCSETDYLMSLGNYDYLKKAIKEFESDNDLVNTSLDKINWDKLDPEAQESEEEKKYYGGFGFNKITPKALLEIGFKEEYQPPEWEAAGFIYYNYRVMNLDLTSVKTTDPDFRVLVGCREYPVRNLEQLTDLINILEEVAFKKE